MLLYFRPSFTYIKSLKLYNHCVVHTNPGYKWRPTWFPSDPTWFPSDPKWFPSDPTWFLSDPTWHPTWNSDGQDLRSKDIFTLSSTIEGGNSRCLSALPKSDLLYQDLILDLILDPGIQTTRRWKRQIPFCSSKIWSALPRSDPRSRYPDNQETWEFPQENQEFLLGGWRPSACQTTQFGSNTPIRYVCEYLKVWLTLTYRKFEPGRVVTSSDSRRDDPGARTTIDWFPRRCFTEKLLNCSGLLTYFYKVIFLVFKYVLKDIWNSNWC